MAGIQLKLQKELFAPDNEQLMAMVHCFKRDGKEKQRRDIYLCVLNEGMPRNQPHFNISICEVKGPEKKGGSEAAKRKRTWPLRDLKAVDGGHLVQDGGSGGSESGDFELLLGEKPFGWTAASHEEKNRFLSTLVSVVTRGQGRLAKNRAELRNLPPEVASIASDGVKKKQEEDQEEEEESNGYQAISEREERDLLRLMKGCECAVTNADAFMEDLQRELNLLDGANIHSIMASEESVEKLMAMLEESIRHVEALERRLDGHDELLEGVRDSMDQMNGGDFETVNANNKSLLEVLEFTLDKLDVSMKHQAFLAEAPADFDRPEKLREAVEAAWALRRALEADVPAPLLHLKAVKDQRKRCEKWRDRFSKAVSRHLTNIIVHVGNDVGAGGGGGRSHFELSRRGSIHKELVVYADLVHWLKSMDRANFSSLQSAYRTSMCKLYDRDLKRFFEMARQRVGGGGATVTGGSTQDLSGGGGGGKRKSGLLGNDTDSLGSELTLSERERFDDVLETVLVEMANVCMDEQTFSVEFFEMDRRPKRDKLAMEAARSMMAEIFPSLESELSQFVSSYEKADGFFALHALVRLSRHVLSSQDTGSFLAISLGTVLVQVKRSFDRFMQLQLQSIDEARAPSRRAKCGILPFVANFERFVATTESIFRGSERRVDLEKWYGVLATSMFAAVSRISAQHAAKTPAEVVKMENFHHLHALLSRTKIATLEAHRKEAKAKYGEALRAYVTSHFGRPLERLNLFFDGVQGLVSAGVKESEVGYQLAYSKQELRKVIAVYPGKEVRKGLDSLYRKVERHLCEEEGLVQVVWRAMQEEFITQYKCIEDLIQRCYPGAQLSLDFAIENVLQYFSDIARSH